MFVPLQIRSDLNASSLTSVTLLALVISGLKTGVEFKKEMVKIKDLSKLTVILSTFAS